MRTKKYLIRIWFIATMVAALLCSCDFSQVRIGGVRVMYGTNEDGHISYNYSVFTGIETGSLEVEAGQNISFNYAVTVNKGSLLLEWQDPDSQVVWRKNLLESERGEDEITVESSGIYRIIIQGKNAGGEFEISWDLE